MSLKPIKHSEQKKQDSKTQEKMKKRKKSLAFDTPPPYTFIVSEGTKT